MAKQIKAIKCPQCGSPDKTEIKPDHFKCKKCGTEYFLDSDDVTINHNINYPVNNTNPNAKKILTALGVFFGIIFLLSILSSVLFRSSHKNNTHPNYGVYEASSKPEKTKEKWNDAGTAAFESADGKAIYLVVGTRETAAGRTGSSDNQKVCAGFYEIPNTKSLKMQQLPIHKFKLGEGVKFRQFENGDLYLITNKSNLYKIDKQFLTAEEVGEDFYNSYPDLQSGFASVEFVYENYGDGFKVMTNDGKERYFFPIIGKVYNKDRFYDAINQNPPANARVRTAFKFSHNDSDYEEERIQLVKYTQKAEIGVPRDEPPFGWRKDYGGSGFFTDASPYRKVFLSSYYKQRCHIVNYTDMTPDRLYFGSEVICFDDKSVLIKFRATAAENAPLSIQALDANNAQILWTYPLEDNNLYIYSRDSKKLPQGYFVKSSLADLFFGNDGKLVAKLNKKELD
ncbi:MAG: hypothetical protein LBN18_06170 [Dysgonamonadaceae bacterium]|jgi:hypothetical protein|nr:hypothetical protein [Dysgonamonadaceae bacterium]